MIDIINESDQKVDEQRLVGLATFALDWLRIHPSAELSILLVDETAMSAYHEKFMGLPGPTDVLSFPTWEPGDPFIPPHLGDIVISLDTAARQAEAAGLEVVMDRCVKIEHARFHGGLNLAGFVTGVISSRRQELDR